MDNLSAGKWFPSSQSRKRTYQLLVQRRYRPLQLTDSAFHPPIPEDPENWMASGRNGWMTSIGITGWLDTESVDDFVRNRWMACPGIRRERLIVKFGIIAGMRPGEIFALRRGAINKHYADISERVYRGIIDTPKSSKSVRKAAFSEGLLKDLTAWMKQMPDTGPAAWLFPSENLEKPLSRDNMWRRYIRPKLKTIGLDWVNFLVLRRTHSTLMRGMNVDPKLVADQQGHAVDVNLNVYTEVPVELKKLAVDGLESTLIN